MARTYEVVLDINGRLGNLQNAVGAASRSLQSLGRSAQSANALASRATQQLQSRLQQLNANARSAERFRELNSSIASFTQHTAEARQNALQLYSELARQERQVEQMRQSFANLQVARNNGQVTGRAVSQGRAELRAAEQGLNSLRSQYNTAQANADALNSSLRRQTSELQQLRSAFQNAGVGADNLASHEQSLQRNIDRTTQQLQRQQNIDNARGRVSQASFDVSNAYGNFQGAVDTAKSIMSPITQSVDVYANFDATMSQVKAVTGVTGAQFDALKAKAQEMGSQTQFSATEAAQAMVKLGKTGWTDAQILGGIRPLLQTAIAGGADLSATADIVSDTMSAFGKVAGQDMTTSLGQQMEATQRFADVFAATASNANTDINMMGETFKYAAATAGSLGYSIEDVALATGIMGNNAVKGSMAGTALNSIMTRLVAPPSEAAKSLDALGFSAKNADGTLKPFRQQLVDLREKFKNLSAAEQAEYAKNIAGAEAMKGFLAVMNTADADFDRLAGKIDNSAGATDKMAATMSDNLEGARKSFEAAQEAVQLSLGKAFEPATRGATEFATEAARGLAEFVANNQGAAQAVGALAAGLAAATVGLAGFGLASSGLTYLSASFDLLKLKATSAVASVRTFWATMTAGSSASAAVNVVRNLGTAFAAAGRSAMAFVFSPVGAVLTALAVAGLYCYQNWERVAPIFSRIAGIITGGLGSSVNNLSSAFGALGTAVQSLLPALGNIGGVIFGALAVAVTAVAGIGTTIVTTISGAVSSVINIFSGLGNAISSLLAGNWDGIWNGLVQSASAAVDGIKNLFSNLFGGLGDTVGNIFSTIQDLVGGGVSANVTAESVAQPAIDTSQTQAQIDALGQSAQSTADAQQNIAQVGADFTNLSASLGQVGTDLTTATTGVQTFNTEATTAGTNLNLVGTNAQTTSTELTTLQNSATAASPALQQVQQSATQASSGLSQIGSSASSAASGLSQISGAAGAVASALQAKASQIASISISAPKVAANAKGGIYKQGAFLTTFAEKSPEAAIPLDNSQRAKDLFLQVGQMLGMVDGDKKSVQYTTPRLPKLENIFGGKVSTQTLPQQKTLPTSGNIFSGRISTSTIPQQKTPTIENLPRTQTLPQNKTAGLGGLGNIFSGGVKLPATQGRGDNFNIFDKIFSRQQGQASRLPELPEVPKVGGVFDSLLEKILPTSPAPSASPQITVNITIQGNADASTMQTAGQVLAVDLKRELDNYLRERDHDKQRASFV